MNIFLPIVGIYAVHAEFENMLCEKVVFNCTFLLFSLKDKS